MRRSRGFFRTGSRLVLTEKMDDSGEMIVKARWTARGDKDPDFLSHSPGRKDPGADYFIKWAVHRVADHCKLSVQDAAWRCNSGMFRSGQSGKTDWSSTCHLLAIILFQVIILQNCSKSLSQFMGLTIQHSPGL